MNCFNNLSCDVNFSAGCTTSGIVGILGTYGGVFERNIQWILLFGIRASRSYLQGRVKKLKKGLLWILSTCEWAVSKQCLISFGHVVSTLFKHRAHLKNNNNNNNLFVMRDSLPIPRPHGPALLNYDQANGTIAHFLFNFLP